MFLRNINAYFTHQLSGVDGAGHTPLTTYSGVSFPPEEANTYTTPSMTYKLQDLMKNIGTLYGGTGEYYGTNPNKAGVIFGTGNTPPTKEDHCFSGSALTALKAANIIVFVKTETDEEGVHIRGSYTISNTTAAEITVGEVGLMECCSWRRPSTNSNNQGGVLLERTVLDTPITIPAGGVGVVQYTINLGYTIPSEASGEVVQ